jgi:hypothetical protein
MFQSLVQQANTNSIPSTFHSKNDEGHRTDCLKLNFICDFCLKIYNIDGTRRYKSMFDIRHIRLSGLLKKRAGPMIET